MTTETLCAALRVYSPEIIARLKLVITRGNLDGRHLGFVEINIVVLVIRIALIPERFYSVNDDISVWSYNQNKISPRRGGSPKILTRRTLWTFLSVVFSRVVYKVILSQF